VTRLSLLFLLAGFALGGEETDGPPPFEWLQFQGNAAHDNDRERGDAITWPKVSWHLPEARGQPTLAGDILYSGGPSLFAVSVKTGEVTARIETVGERMYAQSPVIAGELLIARRSDGAIFGYSRDLRRTVWEHRDAGTGMDNRLTGSWDGGLYLYAAGNAVRALDGKTGRVRWDWQADRPVRMVPASDGKRVYAGTPDGLFVALELRTGRVMWSHKQDGQYGLTSAAVFEEKVIVGDRGVRNVRTGVVRCFEAKSGRVLWEWPFGATGLSNPGHARGKALLGFGRRAVVLDLKTRRTDAVPTGPNAFGSPTMVGKHYYFGNLDGNLYAWNTVGNDLLWRFHVPGTIPQAQRPHQVYDFIHTGSRIYVATSNGLYCLAQDPEKRNKRPNGAVITPTR
jgi:outer membrane protein assembly factor BamB